MGQVQAPGTTNPPATNAQQTLPTKETELDQQLAQQQAVQQHPAAGAGNSRFSISPVTDAKPPILPLVTGNNIL